MEGRCERSHPGECWLCCNGFSFKIPLSKLSVTSIQVPNIFGGPLTGLCSLMAADLQMISLVTHHQLMKPQGSCSVPSQHLFAPKCCHHLWEVSIPRDLRVSWSVGVEYYIRELMATVQRIMESLETSRHPKVRANPSQCWVFLSRVLFLTSWTLVSHGSYR